MNYLVKKDKERRKVYKRSELLKFVRHICFKELRFALSFRSFSYLCLLKMDLLGSRCRIVNRCILTGKAASVNRAFHLSRTMLRSFAVNGLLVGLKKGSW